MKLHVGPTICEYCDEVLVMRPLCEEDAKLVRSIHEGATPLCRIKAAKKRDMKRRRP